MRLSIVWTIYRKELIEALRDRRTLFMMVGLPLLLYPLAMIGMSRLQESQDAQQSARVSRVAVPPISSSALRSSARATSMRYLALERRSSIGA